MPSRTPHPLAHLWRRSHLGLAAAFVSVVSSSGCTPALDWREVRPTGTSAKLLMPCKPVLKEQTVQIEGQAVRLHLQACGAEGKTWGVAVADVADPHLLGAALNGFLLAARAPFHAKQDPRVVQAASAQAGRTPAASTPAATTHTVTAQALPLSVPGASPHALSQRQRLLGRGPDGQVLHAEVAVFARRTQAFQLTVLGAALPAEAAQTFMESVRFDN